MCRKKSVMVWAISSLFIMGIVLSMAINVKCLDHKHNQNGPNNTCTLCAHLVSPSKLLKSLSAALTGGTIAFGCFSLGKTILCTENLLLKRATLVHLKVRLNA